jgi:putative aminopeptidase FrvX
VAERQPLVKAPTFLASVLLVVVQVGASGQDSADLQAIASWTTLDVVTGYETRVAPEIAGQLPGWEADHWGNLVRVVGSGEPRRIVACSLGRPGLSASQITDDGYLRVHRIGAGSPHPLWDQAFEAQQVRVITPSGPIAGVVARRNAHFSTQHRGENAVTTADDLWIDVGATSAAEVEALGIGLLDPIIRHLPAWTLDGHVAGPQAGSKAGCAAAATLAAMSAPSGETHFVLSSQAGFGGVGLSSYVARNGSFDEVVMFADGATSGGTEVREAATFGGMAPTFEAAGIEDVHLITPEVRAPGSHMEVISDAEARWLLTTGASTLGWEVEPSTGWVSAPAPASLRSAHMDSQLSSISEMLTELVELYGVSAHEWSVRRYVLENLPSWAREAAVVDDMGNIWVSAGPDRDTTVLMAHMDEVGFEVESISSDGVVSLGRGGSTATAWEGQTALLHFDAQGAPNQRDGDGADTDSRWKRGSLSAEGSPPIRGVFRTRSEATERNPTSLEAWFGLDGAALAALGVRPGMSVTSYKEGLRLGSTRFVARALDDRAGTTALLLAINEIDPAALPSKVIFAWSVGEEGGLVGAGAMAQRFGRSTLRIYSIDTFVTSDTPLESPHFAYTPLGDGPVLRATENSGVSPDRERARVFAAAARAGIPLQMGLTQGGTDGTRFTFWGAPNQGLSWPGRYSHSPGEVLDLNDLEQLSRLIRTLVLTPES